MALVALMICVSFILAILLIEHKRNEGPSIALWIPTIWMLIYASRPLGRWFVVSPVGTGGDIDSGSPLDRLVLITLMVTALIILYRRKFDLYCIIRDNTWLFLLFLYAGISILWSDIAFVSLKRWIRSTGDILMALVILSERMPLEALEKVLRRCAYVLIPFSLVLIKYFPHLGVAYGRWSGQQMWIGVTLQKNSLGELCALSSFFLIWSLVRDWRSSNLWNRRLITFADMSVLIIAIFLLRGSGDSYSATSISILIVGVISLLLLFLREEFARFVAKKLRVLAIFLVGTYIFLYDLLLKIFAPTFGRDETLTDRIVIWRPVLEFASQSPLLGVGYGGFYAPGKWELEEIFGSQFILAQVHNGYLAVYLELGIVGVILLALFLLAYCGKIRREIDDSLEWGVYGICLLPMALLYNNTEASFMQSSSYFWSTIVFLTLIFSAKRLHHEGRS